MVLRDGKAKASFQLLEVQMEENTKHGNEWLTREARWAGG